MTNTYSTLEALEFRGKNRAISGSTLMTLLYLKSVGKEVLRLNSPPSKISLGMDRHLDEGLRRFLAVGAVVLMLLCPIVFVITGNPTVLLATTIVHVPVSSVYSYYFNTKEKK